MTFIITLRRHTVDNLEFAIWRCQRALEDGKGYTHWKVEGPKGELLAEGSRA